MNKKVIILGVGNMGFSILTGIIEKKIVDPKNIIGIDLDENKLNHLKNDMKIEVFHYIKDDWMDSFHKFKEIILIVSVKPNDVKAIFETLRKKVLEKSKISIHIVSICAGLTINQLHNFIDKEMNIKVTRVMPNLPLSVLAGASTISHNKHVEEEDKKFIFNLFSSIGIAIELDEKYIDAVTGVSGSGPGYVCLFIEALADGGVKAGLPRNVALDLAKQTVFGTAKLLIEKNDHPGVLKDKICSPGGTTIAGISALEQYGLRYSVMKAVEEVYKRSKELGEQS